MARVLLHLEDRFSTPGFLSLRHTTMVALAVTDPTPVRAHLLHCLTLTSHQLTHDTI
jgi:hypothetical protein